MLLQYDSNFTKEIQNKERVWRNRTNILQSSGKNFQKPIFFILQSIKVREDNALRNRGNGIVSNNSIHSSSQMNRSNLSSSTSSVIMSTTSSQMNNGQAINVCNNIQQIQPSAQPANIQQQQIAQQQYNRYDQERFAKNDSALGFSIDTTSTYHGLTLKSVTEGSTAPKTVSGSAVTGLLMQKNNQLVSNNGHHGNQKPQKRPSRTPIIIIPATNTSLITMYNAKAILQDLKYMDSKQCDQRRENEILIQRRKPDNTTVPYRIIDNPLKLTQEEWYVNFEKKRIINNFINFFKESCCSSFRSRTSMAIQRLAMEW